MRDAVQAVEDGSYPKLVERELPIWHRTGTILRRDLWRVFPQWKEEFFQNISRQEVDEFLTSAAGYPLEANRRLPSMTANDFYHACALGYRAMGYAGTEKPDKEQYLLHADGRDEGLSKLDGRFPRSFCTVAEGASPHRSPLGGMPGRQQHPHRLHRTPRCAWLLSGGGRSCGDPDD